MVGLVGIAIPFGCDELGLLRVRQPSPSAYPRRRPFDAVTKRDYHRSGCERSRSAHIADPTLSARRPAPTFRADRIAPAPLSPRRAAEACDAWIPTTRAAQRPRDPRPHPRI